MREEVKSTMDFVPVETMWGDRDIWLTIERGPEFLTVAKELGYSKPQNAIDRHCKCALKRGIPHPQSPDKTIEMLFIPECDIYRLAAKQG